MKMNVGILTYHQSHNYGALLQAYSLKNYLIKQGYEVRFVDYFPDYHIQMYENVKRKPFKNLPLKQKLKYPLYYLVRFYPLYWLKKKRRKSFISFINEYILDKSNAPNDYDVVIYGSDQIWRKQKRSDCLGFNDVYFGSNFVQASKKIAFSASMGVVDLSEEDKSYLSESFKRFSAISVREKELFLEIKQFSEFPIEITLDPVFLLEEKEWNNLFCEIEDQNYVLVYNLLEDKTVDYISQKVSEKFQCKKIEIRGSVTQSKYPSNFKVCAGPKEFLSLIKSARFVVTSSFHGVAFSLLFRKQFYTYLPVNSARVTDLLSTVGCIDRFIDRVEDVDIGKTIDYSKVFGLLRIEIDRSKQFLIKHLQN